ncbi:MAG: NAD-dependent epimerase/dehydratase family protein, partial [Bacteroidota bacterium]
INQLFEKHNFTYIYHLAAYAAEGLSPFIRSYNYKNNLIGSTNLINAAVNYGVECFVFTSSIAVYGSGSPPFRENDQPIPEDPYGIAKYAVELDLENARKMFGLNHIIFRPHNVYGPNQNIGDRYRNVVGIFMNQILNDQSLSIFGDGKQTRAFTNIDDVAPYIAESVNQPLAFNKKLNIGTDKTYSLLELADAVCSAMNSKQKLNMLENREEVLHAYADHSEFNKIFSSDTQVSLSEGLEKMASWVKSHGARTSKPFSNIEIKKGLPETWK